MQDCVHTSAIVNRRFSNSSVISPESVNRDLSVPTARIMSVTGRWSDRAVLLLTMINDMSRVNEISLFLDDAANLLRQTTGIVYQSSRAYTNFLSYRMAIEAAIALITASISGYLTLSARRKWHNCFRIEEESGCNLSGKVRNITNFTNFHLNLSQIISFSFNRYIRNNKKPLGCVRVCTW